MIETIRPCLDPFFSSLNFRHSSLVTHHSSLITLKYHTYLAPSLTWHHHSLAITQYFSHCLWDSCLTHSQPLITLFASPFSFHFFPSSFSASPELFSAFCLEIHPFFVPLSLGFFLFITFVLSHA